MDRLHAAHPLRASGLALIAVQHVCVERYGEGSRSWVHVIAEPYALVIVEGGRPRALDLSGSGTPLEPLLREVVGLADTLQTITQGPA